MRLILRFFIDPLFKKDLLDKELDAIQSEFDISISNHQSLVNYFISFDLMD